MRFFSADDGNHYPVSSIRSFRINYTSSAKPEIKVVLDEGGSEVTVKANQAEKIVHDGDAIIPADPHFYYMGLVTNESPKSVWTRPVLAWIVSLDNAPVPITLNGARDGLVNDYVIVQPDGMVIEQIVGDHTDVRTFALAKGFSEQEATDAVNEWRRGQQRPS